MFRMMYGAVERTRDGRCAAVDWGEGRSTNCELSKGVVFDVDLILPTTLALRFYPLRLVIRSARAIIIK